MDEKKLQIFIMDVLFDTLDFPLGEIIANIPGYLKKDDQYNANLDKHLTTFYFRPEADIDVAKNILRSYINSLIQII